MHEQIYPIVMIVVIVESQEKVAKSHEDSAAHQLARPIRLKALNDLDKTTTSMAEVWMASALNSEISSGGDKGGEGGTTEVRGISI